MRPKAAASSFNLTTPCPATFPGKVTITSCAWCANLVSILSGSTSSTWPISPEAMLHAIPARRAQNGRVMVYNGCSLPDKLIRFCAVLRGGTMALSKELYDAILNGDAKKALAATEAGLAAGEAPLD